MDRNNNFTMIHIMAALMVLVGHMFIMMGREAPMILADGWRMHEVGVGVLFMVSGYLTTLSYRHNRGKKARALRYLVKRLIRLYPSLIVCLLATVLVMRLVTVDPLGYWPRARLYFLNNLKLKPDFFLAGVFGDNIYPNAVNGSLWTLPIEVACYCLLIPVVEVVLRLPERAGSIVVGALMVACSLFSMYRLLLPGVPPTLVIWDSDWMEATRLIMWFLIGVFCAVIDVKRYLRWQAALALVVLYACLYGTTRRLFEPYIYAYLAMCFGLAEKPMFARVFRRDICYGLYLYSFPVAQLIVHFLLVKHPTALPTACYVALCVAVTWAVAELNYFLVERSVSKVKFLKRIT